MSQGDWAITHLDTLGIAAERSEGPSASWPVAPTFASAGNRLRLPLRAIGCWRAAHAHFAFDASFIDPGMRNDLRHLGLQRRRLAVVGLDGQPVYPPASLYAHADPSGDDAYNKRLAARRAQALHALLTRDVARWEQLYSTPLGHDDWRVRAVQTMLNHLCAESLLVDGVDGEQTRAAVSRYQQASGLAADGVAGPGTRAGLFAAYMEALCGPGLHLHRQRDFLARGADAQGKGDLHACGEFNPLILPSAQDQARFEREDAQQARNAFNAPNRRVLVLLFAPGARIDPALWPCPAAEDGDAGCRRRFWSDAATRRQLRLPDAERRYARGQDTFACRFYERLVDGAACEKPVLAGTTRWEDAPLSVEPALDTGQGAWPDEPGGEDLP
ncbi:MAG: peptidoglycan-binding protein [Pseudoxanthomonas sp.]